LTIQKIVGASWQFTNFFISFKRRLLLNFTFIANLIQPKMLIVRLHQLSDFAKKHADARKSLATWQDVTEKALWKSKQDVLTDFPKAKILKNSRARFEIKHNTYRLIVYINYYLQSVTIRFIGTHTEYDRIDPETI